MQLKSIFFKAHIMDSWIEDWIIMGIFCLMIGIPSWIALTPININQTSDIAPQNIPLEEKLIKDQKLFSYIQNNISQGTLIKNGQSNILTSIQINPETMIQYNSMKKLLLLNYRGEIKVMLLNQEKSMIIQNYIDALIFNQPGEMI